MRCVQVVEYDGRALTIDTHPKMLTKMAIDFKRGVLCNSAKMHKGYPRRMSLTNIWEGVPLSISRIRR
jgi:hypothetical protein